MGGLAAAENESRRARRKLLTFASSMARPAPRISRGASLRGFTPPPPPLVPNEVVVVRWCIGLPAISPKSPVEVYEYDSFA